MNVTFYLVSNVSFVSRINLLITKHFIDDSNTLSETCNGVVQATSMFIRAQPNTQSEAIGSLFFGDLIYIQGRVNGEIINGNVAWLHLEQGGYVAAYYVWVIASDIEWCIGY